MIAEVLVGPITVDVAPVTGVDVALGPVTFDVDLSTGVTVDLRTDGFVEVQVGDSQEVDVSIEPMTITLGGSVGAKGETGEAGNTSTKTAAVTLGGGRACLIDSNGEVNYADEASGQRCTCMIRSAVSAGDPVVTYLSGEVNGFSGLVEGDFYFLGANGLISNTVGSVTIQYLGVATAPDTLLFEPSEPVIIE